MGSMSLMGTLTRSRGWSGYSTYENDFGSHRGSFASHNGPPAGFPSPQKASLVTDVAKAVGGVVKKRKHIVLLGLDGSGKTTILMRLKYGCFVATAPTIGFNHEKVWGGGFRWSVWDVGGGDRLRPLWSTYARATDAVMFVVDASAPSDLMEEARVELARVVKISRQSSSQLRIPIPPFIVLANFQDHSFARSAEEVATSLGLAESWASGVTWAVAPVCGVTGDGLYTSMSTLRTIIDKTRQEARKRARTQPNR